MGSAHQSGIALIVVLAMLVLVLGIVMAFFSLATQQRQVSATSAANAEAGLLARTALNVVIDDVLQEINAGSEEDLMADATVGVRLPTMEYDEDLERWVAPSMMPERVDDNGIANILKVSRGEAPFFTGGTDPGPVRASSVGTDEPSLNGKRINKERWNGVRLMTDEELEDFEVPDWVYLDREGNNAVAFGDEALADASPENGEYVIGRYSYVLYDVGGLLDINALGNTLSEDENRERGRLHQVSLEGGIEEIEAPDFETFVEWRWPETAGDASDTAGDASDPARKGLFDPQRTFVDVEPGEQAFVGRQDLIEYATQENSPIPEEALPYLTTYSRSLHAPSHTPDPDQAVIPDEYFNTGDTPQDELNPGLLDDSVRFKEDVVLDRPEGAVKVEAGTPVMARRFPLGKLSLLSEEEPEDEDEKGEWEEELLYYFGLEKQADGSFHYVARIDDRLATLEKVAELRDGTAPDPDGSGDLPKAREPNFFEVLQAVIGAGSTGKSAGSPEFNRPDLKFGGHHRDNTAVIAHPVDSLRNRQILQIGANIIDQWDEDDLPTTIRFPSGLSYPDPDDDRNFVSVYGIENLPYITQITNTPYRNPSAIDGAGAQDCLQLWALFDVWNPHQNAETPEGITNFRVMSPYGVAKANVIYALHPSIGSTGSAIAREGIGSHAGEDWSFAVLPNGSVDFTTPDGGARHALKDSSGNVIIPSIKELNEEQGVELVFPTAAYAEPTTVGSGEPTQPNHVPGLLLAHHNFSKSPIYPHNDRPNAAIPKKEERPANIQKTLNYLYDRGPPPLGATRPLGMFPYTATESDGTFIRRLDSDGNSRVVSNLETEGAGGERIYPPGTIFSFPGNHLNYWSVTPPPPPDPDNPGSFLPTTEPTTVYAKHGTKSHNYLRFTPGTGSENIVFDLQAEINGEWVTYQRIEGWWPMAEVYVYNHTKKETLLEDTHHSEPGANLVGFYEWKGADQNRDGGASYTKADPRSVRFGISPVSFEASGSFLRRRTTPWDGSWSKDSVKDWVTPENRGQNILQLEYAGTNLRTSTAPAGYNPDLEAPGFEHFWPQNPMLYGLVSNNPDELSAEHPMRYADIDGVVRPADGYWGALPTVPGRTEDRSIILNRPFRSVGEMGYVFRDTPWKSLDFSTRHSGDLGLLDAFSLDEPEGAPPVVAGKVNLNTRQVPVLEVLLRGAGKQGASVLTEGEAEALAQAIVAASEEAPFRVPGDLVSRGFDRADATEDLLDDTRKTEREAAVRALAEVGMTRTWNFLLDLVVQSGSFPQSAQGGADFMVRAEERLWVHLAVDRLTGRVVDMNVERVYD